MTDPKITGRGGKREGAGRPFLPTDQKRKRRILYLNDAEFERLQKLLPEIKSPPSKE